MDYGFAKDNREINSAKLGFIFSIITIALNTIFGYVVMRQILSSVGDVNYGIYKSASSLCGTVSIFDFGISVVAMRYLSSFYKKNDKKGFENYLCMSLIFVAFAALLILVFGAVFFVLVPTIYRNTLESSQMLLCRVIFAILCGNMILTILSNLLCAAIGSCRKHYLSSGIKTLNILVKIILCIAIFTFSKNILLLAIITIGTTLFCILLELLFIKLKLNVHFRLSHFDKVIFKDSIIFCGALFFQSIAILLNGNVDNIFIGSLISPEAVAIYSFAILLLNTVEQIGALFSPLSFPRIVDYVDDNDTDNLFNVCERIGRIQIAIILPIVLGFILFGKPFITLWLGENYIDVYYLAIIMIVPRFLELIINTNINILKAKGKLRYRSYILVATMIINLLLTYFGIKLFGYFGASFGTALAILIGDIICSSFLYLKVCKINVLKLYGKVFSRIWIAGAIPFALLMVFGVGMKNVELAEFIRGLFVFASLYCLLLLIVGFKEKDKQFIFNFKGNQK